MSHGLVSSATHWLAILSPGAYRSCPVAFTYLLPKQQLSCASPQPSFCSILRKAAGTSASNMKSGPNVADLGSTACA